MTRENRFLKKFFASIKSWFNSIPNQTPNFNFLDFDFGVCDFGFWILDFFYTPNCLK
jgi:hypothetical protein